MTSPKIKRAQELIKALNGNLLLMVPPESYEVINHNCAKLEIITIATITKYEDIKRHAHDDLRAAAKEAKHQEDDAN